MAERSRLTVAAEVAGIVGTIIGVVALVVSLRSGGSTGPIAIQTPASTTPTTAEPTPRPTTRPSGVTANGIPSVGNASEAGNRAGWPCIFYSSTSCKTTSHNVEIDLAHTFNPTGCIFTVEVDWGDGVNNQLIVPDSKDLLAYHTYANSGSYSLSTKGRPETSSCPTSAYAGDFSFTLLPS